jgi:hypothetical protein
LLGVRTTYEVPTISILSKKLRRVSKTTRIDLGDFKSLKKTLTKKPWSCAVFEGKRHRKADFVQAECIALDFDGGITMSEALDCLGDYEYVLGTTKSHLQPKQVAVRGPDGKPLKDEVGNFLMETRADERFRIILRLDRVCTSRKDYEATVQGLFGLFGGRADEKCSDASRCWFPFREIVDMGGTRPVEVVDGSTLSSLSGNRSKATISNPVEIDISSLPAVSCSGDVEKDARAFARRWQPAVSGKGGHLRLYRAASVLVCEFMLSDEDALNILATEYNPRCRPTWELKDLERKVTEVRKHANRHVPGYGLDKSNDVRWTLRPDMVELVRKAESLVPYGGFDLEAAIAGQLGNLVVSFGWKREHARNLVDRVLHLRGQAAGRKRVFKDHDWANRLSKWLEERGLDEVELADLLEGLGADDTQKNRIRLGKAMGFLGWSRRRSRFVAPVDETSSFLSGNHPNPTAEGSAPVETVEGPQAYVRNGECDPEALPEDAGQGPELTDDGLLLRAPRCPGGRRDLALLLVEPGRPLRREHPDREGLDQEGP